MFLKPDASVMLLYIPGLPFLLFRRIFGRLGPRSVFLVWTAALKKIITLDVLSKICVSAIDLYCVYKNPGESVSHPLLHCQFAGVLQNSISALSGLSWLREWWISWHVGN